MMTIKTKKPAATPKIPAEDDEEAKRITGLYLHPSINASRLILAYNPEGSLDLIETCGQMKDHAKAVNGGDLSQAEAMLINQAQALQAIFVNFAERAKGQTGLAQIQTMLGLALKAQSQCRATLQTLVDVKYPKQATFIKQANIASQQQVNNGTSSREEKTIQSNELLEDQHGKRMDTGKASAASCANPQMETVGAINRA